MFEVNYTAWASIDRGCTDGEVYTRRFDCQGSAEDFIDRLARHEWLKDAWIIRRRTK